MLQIFSGENKGPVVGLNWRKDNTHVGVSFVTNDFVGENKTKWYGTGQADLQTES